MNLFTFRKMEEDHYTNILMYILQHDDHAILPLFIQKLIGERASEFDYKNLGLQTFSKSSPNGTVPLEYVVGIAPYSAKEEVAILENNLDSIPDAWIYGENFTLLLEFKIRGTLDEGQLAAHKKKLVNCKEVLRLEWRDVISVLASIKGAATDLQKFLLEEFEIASLSFNEKRPASGMPNEIIGGSNKSNDLHFVITGSNEIGSYTIDISYPGGVKQSLVRELPGIQDARRWIANYVQENYRVLPLEFLEDETIISDFCVKPGRLKNAWNQWRLGSYLL